MQISAGQIFALGFVILGGMFLLLVAAAIFAWWRNRNNPPPAQPANQNNAPQGPMMVAANGVAAMSAALGSDPAGADAGSLYQQLPGGGILSRRWDNRFRQQYLPAGAQMVPAGGPQPLPVPQNPPAPQPQNPPLGISLTPMRTNIQAAGPQPAAWLLAVSGGAPGVPITITLPPAGMPATVQVRLVGANGAILPPGTPIQSGTAVIMNAVPGPGAVAGSWNFTITGVAGAETAQAPGQLVMT